jgi:hypothetical protein
MVNNNPYVSFHMGRMQGLEESAAEIERLREDLLQLCDVINTVGLEHWNGFKIDNRLEAAMNIADRVRAALQPKEDAA